MKAKLRNKIRSALLWALVPPAVATVVGWLVNRYVPILNTWAIAGLAISLVALIGAWRAKNVPGKISWARIFYLLISLAAFVGTGHFEWKHLGWPWSPWAGAIVAGVIWMAIGITIAFLIGRADEEESKPTTATPTVSGAQQHGGQDAKVREVINATLGLRGGNHVTDIEVTKFLEDMSRRTSVDAMSAMALLDQAKVARVEQLMKLRGTGRFTDVQIDAVIAKLLDLELPDEQPAGKSRQPNVSTGKFKPR